MTSATADASQEQQQPRVVNGRQLVAEERLRVDQLSLRLGELSLGCVNAAARGMGDRAEPASAAVNRADHRPCLVHVITSGAQKPPIDVGQGEHRPGHRVGGRPSLGLGVRERPPGRRRGGHEVSVEVVRLCEGGERSDQRIVGLALGDLDRTTAFRDARSDSFVEGQRPDHADAGIDVRRESRGARGARTLGELEEATPLDRPGPDDADGGGRRHRQLGMRDELLVREHLHPADDGAGTAVPQHRQVVVGGDAGDELVIVCGRSVLDRLVRSPRSRNHRAARRWISREAPASCASSWNSANSANSGWTRNHPVCSRRATKRFECSSAASVDAASERPKTLSQSSTVK